mmetsp:Transcript_29274/g.53566  ORF Transcript_29274/g.53566 Transcript_29274/m.53566 type:complete len:212 (+) Transcript_29274:403-1038(+)
MTLVHIIAIHFRYGGLCWFGYGFRQSFWKRTRSFSCQLRYNAGHCHIVRMSGVPQNKVSNLLKEWVPNEAQKIAMQKRSRRQHHVRMKIHKIEIIVFQYIDALVCVAMTTRNKSGMILSLLRLDRIVGAHTLPSLGHLLDALLGFDFLTFLHAFIGGKFKLTRHASHFHPRISFPQFESCGHGRFRKERTVIIKKYHRLMGRLNHGMIPIQ